MSNLNSVQKNVLKTIESKENRKKLENLFIIANKEKELKDTKKLLNKLYKKSREKLI